MKKVRLFESFIGEASRGKIHKAVKAGDYPATIVVIENGKVVHQETVNTPEAVPAAFNVLQKEYPKAKLHVEDRGGQTLFVEGLEANESYSLQHGGGEFKQMDRRVNDADKIGVGKALAKIWNSLGIADGDFDHEQAWAYVVSFMDGSPKFRRLLESFNSIKVSESVVTEAKAFDKLNKMASKIFGEDGVATLSQDEMAKLIDVAAADKMAEKMFGEFGFATLSEDEMEKLINKNPKLVKESVINESLQHGSYYFPKGNVDPVMQPAKGETKYVVICHNTVEMGNNIMYLKDASSNSGQNFEGHVLSAFNTEEEAVKAYDVALKAGKGMTPSCVSFAYGTLTVKGVYLPFEEIDGKRKIIK